MKPKNQNDDIDDKKLGSNNSHASTDAISEIFASEDFHRKSSQSNRFEGQVAVVTGAASGLGLAISKKLLKEGASVVLIDINESALENEYRQYKQKSRKIALDITQQPLIARAIAQVINEFDKIDILVNCAGITGTANVISHEVNDDDLHKVFEVNFMSSFYMTKAVLPHMLKANYGRILYLASIAGKEGNAGMLAYSASKAAVIGMTKVQGKEYAETGITINALAPTVIRTPMVDALPEKQVKYMTDKIPMKRCGTLEEVANVVAYIVSKENSFITGFTFDLSGGRATY